jgi:cytochrome c oxidase cbb3-type subunit 1
LTGWLSFLPGWLDHLKFTNGLVAHSHLAMAGFCTSFLMLLMVEILPLTMGKVLAQKREFMLWQLALFSYLCLMWISGWNEGHDAGFVIKGDQQIKIIYGLRLLCGLVMLWVSVQWWRKCINQTNES